MSVSYRFPGDRALALTFSYDDGSIHDRRLVDILTRSGMKATFNLNNYHSCNHVQLSEYKSLYIDNGHELACHGSTHPFLEKISAESFVNEIRDNRLEIEDKIQMPVKGMAYPCGIVNEQIKTMLRALGIVYSRTTNNTGNPAKFPGEWLEWNPTIHHSGNIMKFGDELLKPYWADTPRILYIWGHSFEFSAANNWNVMEDFCSRFQNISEIWYATNMEIYEYIEAFRNLIFSADCSIVKNPSCQSVYVRKNGITTKVPPGATIPLTPAFTP